MKRQRKQRRLRRNADEGASTPVLQTLLHHALRACKIQRKRNLHGSGEMRATLRENAIARTSHSSPMASNQPLKLSMLRGNPSTRKFHEGEENIALERRLTVTSTGTILPSLMKLGTVGVRQGGG